MIHSKIFEADNKTSFENNLLNKLRNCKEFTDKRVIRSPRAVGDIVQDVIGEELPDCFPQGLIADYSAEFARRAMADVAFCDVDKNYFVVDIKTHNKSTKFNMPNITSVERLSRFYEDDTNFFVVLLVEYDVEDDELVFTNVSFNPIEYFSWDCLTIGALGWGQIQIANANYIKTEISLRKDWMLELCDVLDIFYPKEIEKISKRLTRFKEVREFWEQKND
ncbi:MAG: hypothetical protein FWG45_01915 [Oscillospiraceae bacterium]|nr:hypothetical protein [Oscillospiraceae bacterium]